MEEFRVATADEITLIASGKVVVGDVSTIEGAIGQERSLLAGAAEHQRRVAHIAELAWQRHGQALHDDLVALEPVYLGGPVR